MTPQLERLSVFLPGLAVAGGVMYWAITSANTAAQTSANLAVARTEILARFDRIDSRLENLPAFGARLTELERRADRLEARR